MVKKALILAAGKGTRMGDSTKEIPKVMLPIAGKPMIQHTVEQLRDFGVEDICMNLHYLPDKIRDHFGDGSKFGVRLHYNFEPELMNTSGSLHGFRDVLTDDFFVIYGDVVGNIDLNKWADFHKSRNSDATLIVHESSHPEDSDIVQLAEDGGVSGLFKRPGHRNYGILGNAAWYILSPKVYDHLPEGPSDFIRDVFPKMLESGRQVYGYHTEELLGDVGTPERFKKMETLLSE